MKERLTELIYGSSDKILSIPYISNDGAAALADYLLSEGVILPPCKVGQTVFRITKLYNGETIIVEGYAFEFAITHESSESDKYRFYFWAKPDKSHASREYSIWCEFIDFGKTVFLTREEAEQALKGVGDGEL